MNRVFLISSAAYVEAELIAEFGRLPPAFLPLGNRRLFAHQHASLAAAGHRILLSIPEDFTPEPTDAALLVKLGIEVVRVPPGLTLGQSLVYVINITALAGHAFTVLHGDTVLEGLDTEATDVASVTTVVPPGYPWGYVQAPDGPLGQTIGGLPPASGPNEDSVALTGYFSFSDASLLVQSVTRAAGDFLKGLIGYAAQKPLRPVSATRWLDFGHASTYHASRQAITTERGFNKLTARRRSLSKSSTNEHKIEAEANWFESLPPPLRVFTPAYLGLHQQGGAVSYGLEYLHLPTLSDLFVFGRLPGRAWDQILEACDEFLTACAAYRPDTAQIGDLYLDKTLARLERFAAAAGISLSQPCQLNGMALPSLEQMARLAVTAIPAATAQSMTLVHGDFCFSNILYNFRSQQVRVIDPRGLDGQDRFTAYGDRRYDIGKLHHSAIGKYDFIVAGFYDLTRHGPLDLSLALPDNPSTQVLQTLFNGRSFAGLRPADAAAQAISVLLFLSMLPLHAEDPQRQIALLANAMRLFIDLDQGN